jgi:hypothetical protein
MITARASVSYCHQDNDEDGTLKDKKVTHDDARRRMGPLSGAFRFRCASRHREDRTGQLPRFTDRSIAPGPSARLHLLASFPNRTENVSAQTADFAFARKQSCAAVIFYVYQFDLDVDPAEACIQNSHTSALCGCK